MLLGRWLSNNQEKSFSFPWIFRIIWWTANPVWVQLETSVSAHCQGTAKLKMLVDLLALFCGVNLCQAQTVKAMLKSQVNQVPRISVWYLYSALFYNCLLTPPCPSHLCSLLGGKIWVPRTLSLTRLQRGAQEVWRQRSVWHCKPHPSNVMKGLVLAVAKAMLWLSINLK